MPLYFLSNEECINQLQNYASKKVHSWNPFKFFRKERLKNYKSAHDIAKLIEKQLLSHEDILKIARAIDGFQDSKLQHTLLCFLYTKVNESQNLFITKRDNINQINQIFQELLNKKYRPWWTLFLIEIPYYFHDFRNNLKWIMRAVSDLFVNRRAKIKQNLINTYVCEKIVNQIINEFHLSGSDKDIEQQKELAVILDISLAQTADHTKKILIKEIQRSITEEIPFGQVLISVAVLSSVINSYIRQKENQNKTTQVQAQEILYIIGILILKINTNKVAKSFIPGISELVEAVITVTSSESQANPLNTDKKIGRAFASVAGGAIGGVVGTVIPFVGTYIGAFVGAIVGKTAATRFYQVLEVWQKAPRGSASIIPGYSRAYFTFIDNDAKNILEPLYNNYLETEKKSKIIGDEIAKWLCIYTLLQNSDNQTCDEYLEIINEEMNRLRLEFSKLKNTHGKISSYLFALEPDNQARVNEYKSKIKQCLFPLHQPIIGMINEYFSPALKKVLTPNKVQHSLTSKDLPIVEDNIVQNNSLSFFEQNITDVSPIIENEHQNISELRGLL